jgi:hypothetical protein
MTKTKTFTDYIDTAVTVALDPKKAKYYLLNQEYEKHETAIEGVLEGVDKNGILLGIVTSMHEYEMKIAETTSYQEAKEVTANYVYPTFIPWGVIVAISVTDQL